jgi:hypothetical protein
VASAAQNDGNLIAKVLISAWRSSPAPVDIPVHELDVVVPFLLESGAGGLGWWRLRFSNFQASAAVVQLQQAYRLHTLESGLHEQDLRRVLSVLRDGGVEPILVKGWAAAQLYPQPGLRPYGDIDLCVHPKNYARAKSLLSSDPRRIRIDLHQGFKSFDNRSWEELHERSVLLKIDDVEVRVLSPEDHLRLLCFHFLREGGWRPLWLCDIAAALESRPADFSWEVCLGRNQEDLDWFACAIVLAHCLLEANTDGVPLTITAKRLPCWFVPSILKEWEAPKMPRRHQTPMRNFWRAPLLSIKGLRYHWPNAIEGTMGVRGPFNEMPRLPFQLANCALRTIDYLRRD